MKKLMEICESETWNRGGIRREKGMGMKNFRR